MTYNIQNEEILLIALPEKNKSAKKSPLHILVNSINISNLVES